ncbi:MAG: hypothetical protein U0234_05215 [Sandaracinus sp.]
MTSYACGIVFGITFAVMAGCGTPSTGNDAGGHSVSSPTCEMILERCHPLDMGVAEIHECHELSETNVEADCAAMRDHCFASCTPSDSGGVDGGS